MLIARREEFLKTARPGDLVPVYREILADRLTPVSAYERIAGSGSSFLLESVEGGERLARYSFLGTDPFLTFKSRGAVATIKEGGETRTETLDAGRDALHLLKLLLSRYRFVETEGLPRFCGGAVGFLSYDMVRFFEDLPDDTVDDLNVEDSYFLFTDSLLIFDHVKHRMKVLCNARVEEDAADAYDQAVSRIEALIAKLRMPATIAPPSKRSGEPEVRTNITRETYGASVERCKEYIAA